ncbi:MULTISPECIES: hypothetical protein [unclassified Kitasatospora]|uniref:hypothetical protein n=1 Tax=unclassified Kitasatospora TaxID=2633591 RepID=UPI0033F97BD8
MRRVLTATVDGCALASDRADLLAALADAPLDPVRLTARLLGFPAPVCVRHAPGREEPG